MDPLVQFEEPVQSRGPFDAFPDEVREDVEGLTYLGYLTADLEFCGHNVTLRTLRAAEEIAAGVAVQPYRNTLKEPEAWAQAIVGLALTQVDGDEDFCPPVGPDLDAFARARYRYCGKWFWPTIDYFYQGYGKLLARQLEAVRAMQDFSTRSLHPLSPSRGSLIVPGTFSEETVSEAPGSAL